ncbi:MAG: glycosyl hydrolase [Verrucomicrobia bacterium]|nr:glycosyl hydrolase [Verrucomicrobiota bacterium]
MKHILSLACVLTVLGSYSHAADSSAPDKLAASFTTPPASARPWVYWGWMNGNLTKEGITADLEAMARVGIGGTIVLNVGAGGGGGCAVPAGPVDFMSPAWRGIFSHTAQESARLGLQFTMNDDDGWSGSGGPWVTVENSMQTLTWSETIVDGPKKFDTVLPQPFTRLNHYRDIAAFALPTPDAMDFRAASPKVMTSDAKCEVAALTDGKLDTTALLATSAAGPVTWIQFEFPQPFRAQAVTLCTYSRDVEGHNHKPDGGEIQVSADGKMFRKLQPFSLPAGTFVGVSFAPVESRYYRIAFNRPLAKNSVIELAEITWHADARVPGWPGKAGYLVEWNYASPQPKATGIPQSSVIQLGERMAGDGRLTWDVPPGRWTILRLGHTATGRINRPATPSGTGLECDKLSKAAIEQHFQGFIAKLAEENKPLVGKGFNALHVDSWEVGAQNWTPAFREEFRARRGYDPLPWLPVATGRVIDNADVSERFLWDFRKTIAELTADNYYGHLRSLANSKGLEASFQTGGKANVDTLQCVSRADIQNASFAYSFPPESNIANKVATSAAHIAGKSLVTAEAFTTLHAKWDQHPYLLKGIGDLMLCQGVNCFVIHRYAAQPWLNLAPGMTYGPCGVQFERTTTWFEQSKAWLEYLARCDALLQQGRSVADACVFTGESPLASRLSLPDYGKARGYDYDVCNDETLAAMLVKDGKLVLPSGASYRVLVLPDSDRMTPKALGKIAELVRQGAQVLGPKPERSFSLENYPACNQQVRNLASQLWGDTAADKGAHAVGSGKVYWGQPLAEVFADLKLPPDVEWSSLSGNTNLVWIHRQLPDAEIYFIANQTESNTTADVTFRVAGKTPELWRPDIGQRENAALWQPTSDGRTTVSLRFEPYGSTFVIFRKPASAESFASLTCNGAKADNAELHVTPRGCELLAWQPGRYEAITPGGKKIAMTVSDVPPSVAVGGAWQVSFPPKLGAPASASFEKLISWTEHADPGIKFFSGSATYETEIDLPATFTAIGNKVQLDLGAVGVIAEVMVNGHDLGILWKPPFAVDVTQAIRPGRNTLKIRVTNLWTNRLIGDEQKPPYLKWVAAGGPTEWPEWLKNGATPPNNGRIAFATWRLVSKNTPLLPSGLLGPVTLRVAKTIPINP